MSKRDFERFYKENIDRIYRYVFFRVGRNEAVTEDLVSEIFMKALKHFHKYDETISKSAWIYRIAHNHLANYFRDKKPQVDLDDVSYALEGSDGRDVMEHVSDVYQLEQHLGRLNVDDRELVTMKYLLGYSYKDMSDALERTPDALKVATHRAIKKLRSVVRKS